MDKEVKALSDDETWVVVALPAGKKLNPLVVNGCIESKEKKMVLWMGIKPDLWLKASLKIWH